MYKLDLHVHCSPSSKDSLLTAEQVCHILKKQILDFIAITDHDNINTALKLQQDLGQKIIIGQEIMTNEGEIIGLYLNKTIPTGLNSFKTIQIIKDQGGIVYIPHPFEHRRRGLSGTLLNSIKDSVDIIETHNGRAFIENQSQKALLWAKENDCLSGASSDAHGINGLGRTYTLVNNPPSKDNLLDQLKSASLKYKRPTIKALAYPNISRIKRLLNV